MGGEVGGHTPTTSTKRVLSVALERGAHETDLRIADVIAYEVFHRNQRGESDLGKGVGYATIVIARHQVEYINRFACLHQFAEMGDDGILRQLAHSGHLR